MVGLGHAIIKEVTTMLRRMVVAAVGATVAVLWLSSAAFAQDERKDLQVFNDVARSVAGYPRLTVFDDVSASVSHGVVRLTGRVTMPFKADEIEKRVARVPGVRAVRSELQVLPVSIFDDQLRSRIARSIYGNPAFWQYASMVNPPIHIVVENGRVTLTGVVNDDGERLLARSLATKFGALSVDNQLKTDAEVKAMLEKLG
jgi:hyperosmotically inducible protein